MSGAETCSVHTHSLCCDGKASLEAMAWAAFQAGVNYFGASGHSHTRLPWDEGCVLPADPSAYQAEVLRLRALYAGRMEVLLGIEWDSQSDRPPPSWADYWIGSVHNVRDRSSGRFYCIDYDTQRLEDCIREMCGGDGLAMAEGYYEEMAEVAAMKPTILGHLDLIVKLNGGNRYFDEAAPRYEKAALDCLHEADPAASLLEINSGGMFRGYRKTPYPAPFLLREWREMGGRVILTADAHSAGAIIWGYAQSAEAARAAGFQTCSILTLEGERVCPL